jgi:hypothetical protein
MTLIIPLYIMYMYVHICTYDRDAVIHVHVGAVIRDHMHALIYRWQKRVWSSYRLVNKLLVVISSALVHYTT